MPLREDLLNPIPGDNPSGVDVRYDTKLLIYDKIKEARRADDNLAQGDWQIERKVADYNQEIKLAQEALSTKTKDLQLAAWLTEGALHKEGFAGLRQGLELCRGLVADFWDTVYPPVEDGDMELRAAPLDWIGTALEIPLKSLPLVKSGYNWLQYKESRLVGYEEAAQSDKEKEARAQRLADGKLAPDIFDKAFAETPKAFYVQSEKDLDASLQVLTGLDEVCTEKFGGAGPSFGKLKTAIEDVRRVVHTLLDEKRKTEPDPVEETAAAGAGGGDGAGGVAGGAAGGGPSIVISVMNSSEPPDRRDAIASVARAAAFLRKREPFSPAPYLMMRGLRWGELRAAAQLSDATLLEAPPTELRQQVKRLALGQKWNDLLETAENAMSLPCSRAWLDLQRFVVDACAGLGSDYEPIANAIRSELRTLLSDVPQLLNANMLDDTPAANADTKAWLRQLREPAAASAPAAPPAEPAAPPAEGDAAAAAAPAPEAAPGGTQVPAPSWPAKLDSYASAREALQAGQPDKAFKIMHAEIARQRSGRGRFERNLQMVQLCVDAGKDTIAQPLLDDIAAAIETHQLDSWEEKEMVASALLLLMNVSNRIKENAGERQKLFERVCRIDPVQALKAG